MINIIKFIMAFVLLFYIPGLFFFKLLFPNRNINSIESISLFFISGVSLFIIPMTLAYIFQYTWTVFSIIWLIILLIVVLLHYIMLRFKKILNFEKTDKYDYGLILLFFIIAFAMYLHGGCFIADSAHHLAYINKLAALDRIDPYVAMFKGIKEIAYSYAYCIWYGVFAFFNRIADIELRIMWNISPAMFSFATNSALYFFSRKLFPKKEFVLISLLVFYIYEFTWSWLDFKFLPIPDQIARNIFLFVALGFIFQKIYNNKEYYTNAFFMGLIAILMILTHMYSFFAFFCIGGFYFLVLITTKTDKEQLKLIFLMYLISFIMCLPFLILKLGYSNYYKFINKTLRIGI